MPYTVDDVIAHIRAGKWSANILREEALILVAEIERLRRCETATIDYLKSKG